jgi:hypothetical protein
MSIYTAVGTQTAGSATALNVIATAAVRPRVRRFRFSNQGTVSVDSNFVMQTKRCTTAGTSTAVTPAPKDPNDPASTFTAGSAHTAEPTYTASTTVEDVGVNPRGIYVWTAVDPEDEIIMPATASNGVGFFVNALGGATTVRVTADVRQ